jgi:U6 snRNA-associated Sm-like protein LSm8
VLSGFDQKSNVILSDCTERVYSLDDGVEEIPIGVYLVKGDMMSVLSPSPRLPLGLTALGSVLVGELDEETEKATDLTSIRAEQMPPIRHAG